MQDRESLQEIENLGEDEHWEEPQQQKKSSVVPILQIAVCALILLALVCLKLCTPEEYGKVTQWYHQEMEKEIPLPAWEGAESPTSSPALPSESVTIGGLQQL